MRVPSTTTALADPLAARSVAVLREGQASSGAFVACPDFRVYRYSWLRDGSFCAYALDLVGEHAAAARFHFWVAAALERQREGAEELIRRLQDGERPRPDEMLPARFTLDGRREQPAAEPWPNFQLDGYGMWLWAVEQHLSDGAARPILARAVDRVARYLDAAWALPCWSCWEERDDGQHAATLGAIAAGLDAAGRMLGLPQYNALAARVRAHLVERFTIDGRFKRCATDERVDGSLLWLAVPFAALPLTDGRMMATIAAVRAELVGPGGGLYRYLGDSYYGGGQWLLLTSSLAWVDALAGRRHEFEQSRSWVRAQANGGGELPEQVTTHAQTPAMVASWTARWGVIATPLLWSHAMYLIAEVAAAEAGWNSSR